MENKTIIMLNTRSIFDCEDDDEIAKHTEEIQEAIDKVIKYKDYPCALICKYQDEYHKQFKEKIYDCYLSELFEEMQRFDIKNGVDMCIDEDGYINFIIYGQNYTYKEKDYLITMAMKVLPIDDERNFVDVSDCILFNGKPKIATEQFEGTV